MTSRTLFRASLTLAGIASLCASARAMEHITLRSGAEFNCTHHEATATSIRLYLIPTTGGSNTHTDENYIEVSATSLLRVDILPDPEQAPHTPAALTPPSPNVTLARLLIEAGIQHNVDAELLAAIVHAESNGNPHAVSRTGAQGLMQLMPATASTLGVHNSFAPSENISGGSIYLDQLLTRYHNDIALAAAAYNAGPAAVDRYHGIPPYAETRAYVTRVIREFNRRKRLALTITGQSSLPRLQVKAK